VLKKKKRQAKQLVNIQKFSKVSIKKQHAKKIALSLYEQINYVLSFLLCCASPQDCQSAS